MRQAGTGTQTLTIPAPIDFDLSFRANPNPLSHGHLQAPISAEGHDPMTRPRFTTGPRSDVWVCAQDLLRRWDDFSRGRNNPRWKTRGGRPVELKLKSKKEVALKVRSGG